jgi:hypothetical protein
MCWFTVDIFTIIKISPMCVYSEAVVFKLFCLLTSNVISLKLCTPKIVYV